jgi:hypothetical protein
MALSRWGPWISGLCPLLRRFPRPLLISLLVTIGLGALTRNLDLVVLSGLAASLLVAVIGWRARQVRSDPRQEAQG